GRRLSDIASLPAPARAAAAEAASAAREAASAAEPAKAAAATAAPASSAAATVHRGADRGPKQHVADGARCPAAAITLAAHPSDQRQHDDEQEQTIPDQRSDRYPSPPPGRLRCLDDRRLLLLGREFKVPDDRVPSGDHARGHVAGLEAGNDLAFDDVIGQA